MPVLYKPFVGIRGIEARGPVQSADQCLVRRPPPAVCPHGSSHDAAYVRPKQHGGELK
jgi:hypothetical protein